MRPENKVVQSLWVGDSLSLMEQISIRSYLRQGHEYHLYTYGPVKHVPEGVIVKDANEIIHLSKMHYREFPKLALFADFFRYKLLLDKGGWWTDTDAICLKPFDFPESYVFSSEAQKVGPLHINNGTIKAPAGSPLLQYCWDRCLTMHIPSIPWGASGPALMTEAVNHLGLHQYVRQPNTFCPIPWWEVGRFGDPTDNVKVPEESHALHLWNEMWNHFKMDKKVFPAGSFYAKLRQEYGVSLSNVTACIKTFLRDKSLFYCVETLKAQYPDMSIIVADDGHCSDEKEAKLGVRYLRLPFNVGLSTGRNAMLDVCETPYLLMCEDDFSFNEDSHIERLRDLMDVVDIAAGLVFNVRHWACHGGGVGWDNFGGKFGEKDGKIHRVGFTGNLKTYRGIRYEEADFVLNFFVGRVEALRRVRWDDGLRLAFEHHDFFLRAKAAGLRSARTLDAQVIHKEIDDSHNPEYQKYREDYEQYRVPFMDKWGFDWLPEHPDFPSVPITVPQPISNALKKIAEEQGIGSKATLRCERHNTQGCLVCVKHGWGFRKPK